MKLRLFRLLMRLFWLFPVQDNQVVLTTFNGRLFSCSPKYLSLGLLALDKYKIYYALRKNSPVVLPAGMIRIDYHSLKHYYKLMTSKYIVVNSTGLAAILPYRKKQVLVNTWHGGGTFKVGGNQIFTTKEAIYRRKIFSKNTTFFLASSQQNTEKVSNCMEISIDKFINTGLPRNDIFFEKHPEIIERVRNHFTIDKSKGIILYAPTYRDGPVKSIKDYGFEMLNVENVIEACKKRFDKDFVFMFKAHHDMTPNNISNSCINASDYPDIQELLYSADILITDYSSVQWDFSLQRKPGFLYSPDMKQYTSVHPFDSDYHEWPYETAFSNEELINMILNYDEQLGKTRIEKYLKQLNSYEKGQAVKKTIEIVFMQ